MKRMPAALIKQAEDDRDDDECSIVVLTSSESPGSGILLLTMPLKNIRPKVPQCPLGKSTENVVRSTST